MSSSQGKPSKLLRLSGAMPGIRHRVGPADARRVQLCALGLYITHHQMKRCAGHVYLERLGKPVKIHSAPENARSASWSDSEVREEPDEASISYSVRSTEPATGLVDLYISWSPVYQVPVMYFRVRNAGQHIVLYSDYY